MSAPVIASIVGGVCTILASVLTVAIKRYLDSRDTYALSDTRQRQVEGRWTGAFRQRNSTDTDRSVRSSTPSTDEGRSEHDTEFNLTYQNRSLNGTGWFVSSTGRKDFLVTGEFYDENYLKLSYTSRQDGVKQYGIALMRLSADCTTLSGQFVGYGVNTEGIISGHLRLKKAART